MSLQQLRALVALAERTPALRRALRWQGSWPCWLQQAQELGFSVSEADLRHLHELERQAALLDQSQIPAIRRLR
ncbi:MAG: hypothetical protein ACO23C_03500 [Prochlorococcaceae cyanobacterium]|jgi:Arc/MetJ family transcription regulator